MITYKISEDRSKLMLIADEETKEELRCEDEECPTGFGCGDHECDALEHLICNSELDWLSEQEGFDFFGDMTQASRLCIRDENGYPIERWGYMRYEIASFLYDLMTNGEAVFVNSN